MGIGGIVCINGEYVQAREAVVSVSDQGVLYGAGIFETIRVEGGIPRVLDLHFSRLFKSAGELGLKIPYRDREIVDMISQTARMNGMGRGGVRLTLTAGGPLAGPVVFLQARDLPYGEDHYNKGFTAGFSSIRRNEGSYLVRHKTVNFFDNIMARREAGSLGWDEALFLNNSGEITEGAVSNIFIVKSGKVITPDVKCGLLPGVTRGRVFGACSRLEIAVEESAVSLGDLEGAEEAFLTNALMGLMPLTTIAETPVGPGVPGKVSRALMQEIEKEYR